jgi:hypothetical protein
MADRGWAYTSAALGTIDFMDCDGDTISFRSWNEVADFCGERDYGLDEIREREEQQKEQEDAWA